MSRVVYNSEKHVADVCLNRPDKLNALDLAMHAELCEIWDDIEEDDDVWVVVLRSSGRAFCAGQDLAELAELTRGGQPASGFGSRGRPGFPRLTERFAFSKPVVAAVQGPAYGGGFELALACDLIIAAEGAEFALPEAKLGLLAGAGGVFRLLRQMPRRVAMAHLMTGAPISAADALRCGLVNRVVPREQLEAATHDLVGRLLRAAPLSLRAIKQAGNLADGRTLEEAFAGEYEADVHRRASADIREGVEAFLDKREPVWRGR